MADNYIQESSEEIKAQILKYNETFDMSDVERARHLGLPDGCRMREGAKILSPKKLKIGINCWIGENALLDASGGLEIGDNTSIGLTVFVWTHDSYKLNIKGRNTRDYSKEIIRKPTVIGSNCFIGGPSVIMPGVRIGDKCVISPLSVVYEDVPSRTIYKPYKDFYDFFRQHQQNTGMIDDLKRRVDALEKEIRRK